MRKRNWLADLGVGAVACVLCGCATVPPAVRTGPPTYPTTRIELPNALILTHLAAPDPWQASVDEDISIPESKPSEIQLTDAATGRVLATATSMLTDPSTASIDFRDYRPTSDGFDVFVSASGKTIAVCEDESSVYSNRMYILMRQDDKGTWTSSRLKIDSVNRCSGEIFFAPTCNVYPAVEGVSDRELYLGAEKRHWRVKLDSIPVAETP